MGIWGNLSDFFETNSRGLVIIECNDRLRDLHQVVHCRFGPVIPRLPTNAPECPQLPLSQHILMLRLERLNSIAYFTLRWKQILVIDEGHYADHCIFLVSDPRIVDGTMLAKDVVASFVKFSFASDTIFFVIEIHSLSQ